MWYLVVLEGGKLLPSLKLITSGAQLFDTSFEHYLQNFVVIAVCCHIGFHVLYSCVKLRKTVVAM